MKKEKQDIQENMEWAMSRENPFFPLLPILPFVAIGMLALNVFFSFKTWQKLHA